MGLDTGRDIRRNEEEEFRGDGVQRFRVNIWLVRICVCDTRIRPDNLNLPKTNVTSLGLVVPHTSPSRSPQLGPQCSPVRCSWLGPTTGATLDLEVSTKDSGTCCLLRKTHLRCGIRCSSFKPCEKSVPAQCTYYLTRFLPRLCRIRSRD